MAFHGVSQLSYGKIGLSIVFAYFCTLFLILKCIPLYTSDAKAVVTDNRINLAKEPSSNDINRVAALLEAEKANALKPYINDKDSNSDVRISERVSDVGYDDNVDDATDCLSDVMGDRFRKINDKVYTYTVYFDNRIGEAVLRIMAAVRKDIGMSGNIPYWCNFPLYNNNSQIHYIATQLKFYEMCENHKRLYGGYILTCAVPSAIKGQLEEVLVGYGHTHEESVSTSRRLCIETRKKHVTRRKLKVGVCVPPVYGKIKPNEFIEFIEFNKILGADIFTLYIEESSNKISDEMETVLKYYQTRNVISVVRWQLPVKSKYLWYHGQSLAINDCLYRNMNHFDYLLFIDLDEFLIPKNNMTSWDDVIKDISEQNENIRDSSGFIFKSTIYAPEFSRPVLSEEMKINVLTNRTQGFSFFRNKAMVLPERVFEMGIHHISRSWPDERHFSTIKVSSSIAHVHHYRKCVSEFGVHCERWIKDETVPNKYGKVIIDNVLKTMYDITP